MKRAEWSTDLSISNFGGESLSLLRGFYYDPSSLLVDPLLPNTVLA
jgi:hypothetical protein